MIISVVLGIIVAAAMLYGRIATQALLIGCFCVVLSCVVLIKCNKHEHGSFVAIDFYAQASRLNKYSPTLKLAFFVTALILCIASTSAKVAVLVFSSMSLITVFGGKIGFKIYASILSVPTTFIFLSGLALVFDFSAAPIGALNIPIFQGYLIVTAPAQKVAFLVIIKAIGALSCLYALSLSTPINEIIGVLKKARVPSICIELMYLIYRYVFILLNAFSQMKSAATSRLGFADYRCSLRSIGHISANLLATSFMRASLCFDAMESRCYDGTLEFYETHKSTRAFEIIFSTIYILALVTATIFLRS